tara:strand:- start:29642 stop:30811 length:1170 start_codon:yes stop_codon:yes gene_type:complete
MKKALIITDEYFPTNRSMLSEFFNKEMTNDGLELTWIFRTKTKQFNNKKVFWNGSPAFLYYYEPSLKNLFVQLFFSVKIIFNLLSQRTYDSIIGIDKVNPAFLSTFFSKLFGKKMIFVSNGPVIEFHKYDVNKSNGLIWFLKKARLFFTEITFNLAFSQSSIIHPISNHMKNEFISKKFHHKCFPISERASEIFLKDYSQSKIPNSLVYHGTLGRLRKLEFLLESCSVLKNEGTDFKFFVIGWEETKGDISFLKNKAFELNISNEVIFLGPYPFNFLPFFLSKMEIGLSAIPPEKLFIISTPTKVIEYISLGLPVVCNSEILVQNEIVTKSNAGYSVKYDVNKFSRSIQKLLNDSKLRKEKGIQGKNWITKNWTFKALASEIKKLYKVQ